jgi:hypothetical protein
MFRTVLTPLNTMQYNNSAVDFAGKDGVSCLQQRSDLSNAV